MAMRKIGLIGGMSWESTLTYYRLINEGVRAQSGDGLRSAEILMHSLDFRQIVELQRADRWDEAASILARAAKGLEGAGATCVLICTNTMHLVADTVASSISVPLIHIIDETAHRLKAEGRRHPLLLATRYSMEHGFYADRMRTNGIDVQIPEAADRDICHRIIFDELCQGVMSEKSRHMLHDIAKRGADAGADSVILGCTELGLCVDAQALSLPCFDSTRIHADAAVAFAFGDADADLRTVKMAY